jgi:hypothetical protein
MAKATTAMAASTGRLYANFFTRTSVENRARWPGEFVSELCTLRLNDLDEMTMPARPKESARSLVLAYRAGDLVAARARAASRIQPG